MKILQICAMILCLSLGYVSPTNAAPDDFARHDITAQKNLKKGPRHHRAMSKAMMEDLNLSAEQKAQWEKIAERRKNELAPLREQMQKLREKEQWIDKKYDAEIRKLLNAEQTKKYESMLPQRPPKPEGKRPHADKK